ncbi:MAG: VWA domain-containing protein [Kiritimatiellae bacterium]|nr:VWA domain-containing protein [Kiritimatiellia bacterium]
MKFANPMFLVLVAAVPLAGLFWAFLRARREKSLDRLVAPSLRRRLMPAGANLWGLQAWLILAGLFLCLFAASRPQWGKTTECTVERSRNVVVAIDVSRSMLAEDVRPNRLERAKADVADLIDSLEGDRCALVAFRRTGVVLCPLTTDHAYLRSALEQLSPESAPRGETDLGSAIRASLDALDPAADDHNAIIMISDGGDLRGEAIANAELAKKRGVPIFTVGIGDPSHAATLPSEDGRGPLKFNGETVTVKLEESALKAIADASRGRYVPLATAGTAETTLGAIYRRFLRQVAAKEQNEEAERAAERYQAFLVPGVCLLLAGAMLSKGRFGKGVRNV